MSSSAALRREVTCSALSSQLLAAHCLRELNNYHRGEPSTDTYGLELLHRATIQGDQEAWMWLQHCFSGVVRGWLHHHPSREAAYRLESEENYVAQAFERFWQATTLTQQVEFRTFAAALQYLRASLNGAILDTLRAYSRPGEVSLPGPGEPEVEDKTDGSEVWENLKALLPNEDEQRVAYLLFHCGLKPREIVRFCPQEFRDIREIYRLRRNIMERLLRKADQLRGRFHLQEQG
ncbi:MAG TPA: hypothetical protein VF043_38160 [Ktedonobacteraceae bacterium]